LDKFRTGRWFAIFQHRAMNFRKENQTIEDSHCRPLGYVGDKQRKRKQTCCHHTQGIPPQTRRHHRAAFHRSIARFAHSIETGFSYEARLQKTASKRLAALPKYKPQFADRAIKKTLGKYLGAERKASLSWTSRAAH